MNKAQAALVEMPADDYWVGDPCYGVPGVRWMEWLEAADYINQQRVLIAELDGKPVLGISTAYGDGEYTGNDGNSYPVDAGLIGLVPVSVSVKTFGETLNGMQKVKFDKPFECYYRDGTIVLGHIEIDTDPEEGW